MTQQTENQIDQIADVSVMNVPYKHYVLSNGDDLYLTPHGQFSAPLLMPENYWLDKAWFRANSRRLSGTSMVYKVRTRPAQGRSRDIVLKWNRMGQDIPGATLTEDGLDDAEFNSPFEEFSLVYELHYTRHESPGTVLTQKPLGIYVPGGHIEPQQLGRKPYKLEHLVSTHADFDLDVHRNYAVIYEWIKGLDLSEAIEAGLIERDPAIEFFRRACAFMRGKGFLVADNKIQHLIVRPEEGALARNRDGSPLWAAIDFELLQRTEQRERAVRRQKRKKYLVRQAHRFEAREDPPPHLHRVNIFGVDYIFGTIESTGGALWTVGRDPALFEYFLPEKWRRTARKRLSVTSQIYETTTKENIHLVWKVSRVGEMPDMDPFKGDEKRIIKLGYNSPFEEVALNLQLSRLGVATTYPRAIYMTGRRTETPPWLADRRRYLSHSRITRPDGKAVLRENHDYMIIWGYWNGPDELLAVRDEDHCRGINALQAYRQGIIDQPVYFRTMQRVRQMLLDVGIEDLNLRGNHILLSLDRHEQLVREHDGTPAVRICNFELLKRVDRPDAPEGL